MIKSKQQPSHSQKLFMENLNKAEQGTAISQYAVADMYANGEGIAKKYKKAVEWFRLSAEQGYIHAQYRLARMYEEGKGIKQNYGEAYKWYSIASANEPMFYPSISYCLDKVAAKLTPEQIAEVSKSLSKKGYWL